MTRFLLLPAVVAAAGFVLSHSSALAQEADPDSLINIAQPGEAEAPLPDPEAFITADSDGASDEGAADPNETIVAGDFGAQTNDIFQNGVFLEDDIDTADDLSVQEITTVTSTQTPPS